MSKFEIKELLQNILKEGKILIQSEVLIDNISEYTERIYKTNIKNIYKNSPAFFQTLKTNDVLEKYYKKFIILCSLLDYPNVDPSETFFIEWRRIHCDMNVKSFLIGPQTNSKMKFDYIKYFNSVISPQIETIDGYHQISILQNLIKEISNGSELLKNIENSFERFPKDANGYQLFIDTSRINRKMKIENDFVFDCSEVQIGEPSKNFGNGTNIKKIEFLFNTFSCLQIKLRVWKNLYEIPLDYLKHCFLVFDGVNVFERTIYNSDSDYLRIGGRFVLNGDWFEFVPDFSKTIFRTSDQDEFKLNDVNRFRIYLRNDSENGSLKIKSERTIQIGKVFNYLSRSNIKTGFINVSDRFLFDTFSRTLQELDPTKINSSFENIYYWKEFDPVSENLVSDSEEFPVNLLGSNLLDDLSEETDSALKRKTEQISERTEQFSNLQGKNENFKTYPIQFPKGFNLSNLSEWFIRKVVHNILIVIDSLSEEPKFEFENGILKIEDEIKPIPCFFKGFLFKLVNGELKVIPPEEFENEGVFYRRLLFSNRDFDIENVERINLEGLKLTQPLQSSQSSQKNQTGKTEKGNEIQKIDVFGNGSLAIELNDPDSVIFSEDGFFMRSEKENVYYVHDCKDFENLLKKGIVQRSSKEIELSLIFS